MLPEGVEMFKVHNGHIFRIGNHKAWFNKRSKKITIYFSPNNARISSKENISELSRIISEILSRVNSSPFSTDLLRSSYTESINMFIERINSNFLLSSGSPLEIKIRILLDGEKKSIFRDGAYSSTNFSSSAANHPNTPIKSPVIKHSHAEMDKNIFRGEQE